MSDDLKPHQRLVELPWQARVRSELGSRDELPMIMALLAASDLRSNRSFSTGRDEPRPEKIDPKKAAHRAKVKAARKQKHGGKR